MSMVVVTRHVTGKTVDKLAASEYVRLLIPALRALSGGTAHARVLKELFPRGVVGLKTNCLASMIATPRELADALAGLVVEAAGLPDNDIVIWDRSNRELSTAGYPLNASSSGFRYLGTDTPGIDYDDRFFSAGTVTTLVTRIMTSMVDHSINLPVLKDHSIAGLSGALKNMYGAVRNPNKFHGNNCDPFVADINSLEPLRGKHRLAVIDAVRVQFDKGPGFDARANAYYGGVIVSRDPVAADRVGLEVIERFRQTRGLKSLADAGRPARYLDSARKSGLGECDLRAIDLRVMAVDASGRVSAGRLFP